MLVKFDAYYAKIVAYTIKYRFTNGDVGYTIIDDVLSLPERLPNIYRRLTS